MSQKAGGGGTKKGRRSAHHKMKYQRQWTRTAKNLTKRRKRHQERNPNDKSALSNWERSPILTHHP